MSIERSAAPQTVRGVERSGTPPGHPANTRPGAKDDAPGSFLSLLNTLEDVQSQQDGANSQAQQMIDATLAPTAPDDPLAGPVPGQSTTLTPATVGLDSKTLPPATVGAESTMLALSADMIAVPPAGVLAGAAAGTPGGTASFLPLADQEPSLPAPLVNASAAVRTGSRSPVAAGVPATVAGMDDLSLPMPSATAAAMATTTKAGLAVPTPATVPASLASPVAPNARATRALRPGVDAPQLPATQPESGGALAAPLPGPDSVLRQVADTAPLLQPLAGKASGPRGRWIEVRPNPATNQVLTDPVGLRDTQTQALAAAVVLAEVVGMVKDKPIARDGPPGAPALVVGLSGSESVAAPPAAGFDPDFAAVANARVLDASPAAPDLAIAQRVHYWITRGVQNAELQLDALGGGSVDVRVSVQGNEALVEFRSDQPEARRMLQDAMPQLKDMLKSEGLLLSSGFVGTSAQPDREARGQGLDRPRGDGAQNKPDADALARSIQPTRSSGRAIDVFV